MLLLTVGHFIYQTFFVGLPTYYVLIFTDLPLGSVGVAYDVYLDGKYRKRTFSVRAAPGDTFGLYSAEPLRLPKRNVTLELVPSWPDTARASYRFEIANGFESQGNCDILIGLYQGVPTVEGCIYIDYDASHFADFVETVN